MTPSENRRLQALHAAIRVYESSAKSQTTSAGVAIVNIAKKFDTFLAEGKTT